MEASSNGINGYYEGIFPDEEDRLEYILQSFPSDTDFRNKKIPPELMYKFKSYGDYCWRKLHNDEFKGIFDERFLPKKAAVSLSNRQSFKVVTESSSKNNNRSKV